MNFSISSKQFVERPLPMESIIVAQQLVLLPLYFFVPIWIALLNTLSAVAVFYSYKKPKFQVTQALKLAITFIAIAGILFVFRKFSGRDAGIALITAMYGLKILEVKSRRDANLLLSLGFFMIVAGFLFSQKPLIAIYQFIPVLMILNAFIALNSIDRPTLFKSSLINVLKELGRYLIFALPIMMILFVFFPRLGGPIWRMPGSSTAASGVSDSMSPGEISSLQLFDEIAFRAKFDDKTPKESNFYWRLLVLDEFDGLTWTRAGSSPMALEKYVDDTDESFNYSITLEPTKLNYLVTLDKPVSLPRRSGIVRDFVTYTPYKIQDRTRYSLSSAPSLEIGKEINDSQKNFYTQLPSDGNQRSRQWAVEQRNQFASDFDYLQSLLLRINQQEYFYTLSPPIMDADTVDSFWFNYQRGFCEHYSSTFVFLARAAGIPARVVVGYQGGEKNPLSDYWIIRYANAHAWTEVWLPEKGWIRIDPTAAIAQHRIEQQLLDDYRQRDSLFDSFDVVDLDNLGVFKQLEYWFDQMNSNWNDWILDYNSQRQSRLFSNLGIEGISNRHLVIAMLLLVTGFLAMSGLKAFHRRRVDDPVEKAFKQLLKRLISRQVISTSEYIGPTQLIDELARQDDSTYSKHIQVIHEYIKLRYQQRAPKQEHIKRLVAQFKSLRI